LQDALLHVHPALERLLGKHFRRRGVLRLLTATGTPAAIAALGQAKIKKLVATGSPRIATTLPGEILSALTEQTVTIPATEQYGRIIRGLAHQLLSVLEQREVLAAELEELLATHPLAEILTSMPGVGTRTAIELLRTVGDGSSFASAAHIASYAGLAPTTASRPLHQGRTSSPPRKPSPTWRALHLRVRQSQGPVQPHLLRPQASRGQVPHCCADMSGPPPSRRPPRDDP
jgi:transposase